VSRPLLGLLCIALVAALGCPRSKDTNLGSSQTDAEPKDTDNLREFLGTWHGTSTCVNLQVTPACKDEVVVYEVRRSEKPGAAILSADKVVNGQRLPMGDLEFVYDAKEACWRSELNTPRVHAVWSLKVVGRTMTGHLRDIPTDTDTRDVRLDRE
jgi:hypothetical protein